MYTVNGTGDGSQNGNGGNGSYTTTTSYNYEPEYNGMCEECRSKYLKEAEMMVDILNTEAASDNTKQLADDILMGLLYSIYCEDEEETTHID